MENRQPLQESPPDICSDGDNLCVIKVITGITLR